MQAVFWMSRNAAPKETLGRALRDVQKTAAKATIDGGKKQKFWTALWQMIVIGVKLF